MQGITWPEVVESIAFFAFVFSLVWAYNGYPKFWKK